ncbi:MAG: CPBP family intramembrane glutamic endopeptidase [Bacteroidota bacterium]
MTTISSVASQPRSGLKGLSRRHPLLGMYGLLFLLTWPGLILEALVSRGRIASQPPLLLTLLTGWGPGIAAVTVSAVLAGRAGIQELLSRFLIWKVGVQWYLAAFFLMAAVILGGIGLSVLFGGAVPHLPAAGASPVQILFAFAVAVLFGILFNTEEMAWRGFALPRLQTKYGVLAGCLLLAIPECLVHLPYFWNRNIDFYQTVGPLWFTAFSVAAVFIYAFLFNKTRGSLLLVTVLHASQNAWANLLSDNSLRPFQFTVALMWMIAIALIFITKGRLGLESRDEGQM